MASEWGVKAPHGVFEALAQRGPAAAPAVPAILGALEVSATEGTTDFELLHLLGLIGPPAREALPVLEWIARGTAQQAQGPAQGHRPLVAGTGVRRGRALGTRSDPGRAGGNVALTSSVPLPALDRREQDAGREVHAGIEDGLALGRHVHLQTKEEREVLLERCERSAASFGWKHCGMTLMKRLSSG